MKKALLYLLAVLGLTTSYQLLLMLFLSVTLTAAKPSWWPNGIFASLDGFFIWAHLAQGVGVLLAALIVAWCIQRFFRERWLIFSFAATVLPVFVMSPSIWQGSMFASALWWSGLLDAAKILLLPPFCCWVMIKRQQLFLNN